MRFSRRASHERAKIEYEREGAAMSFRGPVVLAGQRNPLFFGTLARSRFLAAPARRPDLWRACPPLSGGRSSGLKLFGMSK